MSYFLKLMKILSIENIFPLSVPTLPQTGTTGGGPGVKSGGKASKQVPGKLITTQKHECKRLCSSKFKPETLIFLGGGGVLR